MVLTQDPAPVPVLDREPGRTVDTSSHLLLTGWVLDEQGRPSWMYTVTAPRKSIVIVEPEPTQRCAYQ